MIDISSSDKNVCRLPNTVNGQLRKLRIERRRSQQGDLELKNAVTNISHDLRTPLTAIRGYVELMEDENLNQRQRDYLKIIDEKVKDLGELTEQLFDFSKNVAAEKLAAEENARREAEAAQKAAEEAALAAKTAAEKAPEPAPEKKEEKPAEAVKTEIRRDKPQPVVQQRTDDRRPPVRTENKAFVNRDNRPPRQDNRPVRGNGPAFNNAANQANRPPRPAGKFTGASAPAAAPAAQPAKNKNFGPDKKKQSFDRTYVDKEKRSVSKRTLQKQQGASIEDFDENKSVCCLRTS